MKQAIQRLMINGVFAVLLVARVASAGEYSRWPDFTSESYWRGNHIFLARVVSVSSVGKDLAVFELETLHAYTPHKLEDKQTVNSSAMWFGSHRGMFPDRPDLVKGDTLLIARTVRVKGLYVCTKLDSPSEKSPLVQGLHAISKIRKSEDLMQAMTEGLSSQNDVVVAYSVTTLLEGEKTPADKTTLDRLLAIRRSEDFSSQTRLKADALYERMIGKPRSVEEKTAWIKDALRDSQRGTWEYLYPLVRTLVTTGQREDVVKFLVSLIVNHELRPEIKQAAATMMFEPPCLMAEEPDEPLSKMIFDGWLRSLKDKTPQVRALGANALATFCSKIEDEPKRQPLAKQAAQAIRESLAKETDDSIAASMRRAIERLVGKEE
jgi:hypothetical protein